MDIENKYRSKVELIIDERVNRFIRTLENSQTPPAHDGHRQRLRKKIRSDGELKGFGDAELLETLLSFIIPQRDTKPIALSLLNRFGSLADILNASDSELASITELTANGAALIPFIRFAAQSGEARAVRITTPTEMVNFFVLFMLGEKRRGANVLYLSCDGSVISAERSGNALLPNPRDVLCGAARYSARFVIISAYAYDALPQAFASNEQVQTLSRALRSMGVILLDCIMFTDFGYFTLGAPPNDSSVAFVFVPETTDALSPRLVNVLHSAERPPDRFAEAAAVQLKD